MRLNGALKPYQTKVLTVDLEITLRIATLVKVRPWCVASDLHLVYRAFSATTRPRWKSFKQFSNAHPLLSGLKWLPERKEHLMLILFRLRNAGIFSRIVRQINKSQSGSRSKSFSLTDLSLQGLLRAASSTHRYYSFKTGRSGQQKQRKLSQRFQVNYHPMQLIQQTKIHKFQRQ